MTSPLALELLSCLLWAPATGAIVTALCGESRPRLRRAVAAGFSAASLAIAAYLWIGWEAGQRLRELSTWVPDLGISYDLALDGLGLTLALWIPLLALLALLAASDSELDRWATVLVLVVESSLLGVVMAGDAALFLAFYGSGLTAMTLLLRRGSAMKSFFFFQWSGLALATATLAVLFHLAWVQTGFPSAEIARFATLVTYPDFEKSMFLVGAAAALVALPLFPVSSWVRESMEAGSLPARLLLLGGWSVVGAQFLIRVVLPSFPRGASESALLVTLLASLGTIYAGIAPYRGAAARSWSLLLPGFQSLVVLGLLSSSEAGSLAGRLGTMQLALGLSALALYCGHGEAGAAAPPRMTKLAAALPVLVLLVLPAQGAVLTWWTVIIEEWARSPVVSGLAGLGFSLMALRLVRTLPTLARSAAAGGGWRVKLLAIAAIAALSVAVASTSDRYRASIPPPATEVEEQ